MNAGYWLNPDTGKCVQVATTHDEWVRDEENARSMGVSQWAYNQIMQYPATAIDEIRILALHCGLVRMREHPRYLSVQFAADGHRVARVLTATAAALSDLGIHPDTMLQIDNLQTSQRASVTVAELRSQLDTVFPDEGGEAHPFLVEIHRRVAAEGEGGGRPRLSTDTIRRTVSYNWSGHHEAF